MKIRLLFTASLLIPCGSILAQSNGTGMLDINDAHVLFTSDGFIGMDQSTGSASFEVPAGSGVHALFASGLWMGSIDASNQLKLAAQRFGQVGRDYWPGPLTNTGAASITPTVSQQYDQVWSVLRSDVISHVAYYDCQADPNCDAAVQFPNYVIPQSFLNWPAHGDVSLDQDFYLAPFVDFGTAPNGFYDPTEGDYPCFPGDQALYFIFNDQRVHTESGGQPIGLEIHCTAYAYNSVDQALDQTIFVHYTMKNQGTQTLQNAYAGMFADFDLGNGMDDYIGTDVERGLMYVYNSDNDDESGATPGYGVQPPAFGMTVLRGPFLDYNALDDPATPTIPAINGVGFGDNLVDNELYGLSGSRHFYNSGSATGDPSTSVDYYNHLRGNWNDGTQQLYGGSGHISDPASDPNQPSAFAYPGNSDPNGAGTGGNVQTPWSETGAPDDRRMLGSMGPFTLEPGQYNWVDVAYVYARAGSGGPQASVQALQLRVDSIRDFFTTNLPYTQYREDPFCPGGMVSIGVDQHELQLQDLVIYPVPATDQLSIFLPAVHHPIQLLILDATGRTVRSEKVRSERVVLEISSLNQGTYLVQLEVNGAIHRGRFVKE